MLVGLFTILILKRRLYIHHWQGMLLIAVGAFIVGLSSLMTSDCPSTHRLPPYAPPPGAASTQFNDPCLPNSPCVPDLRGDDFVAPDAAESVAAWAFAPHLSPSFLPQWDALSLASHGSEHAEQCSIGHQPLLGNACVMAAQV